MTKYYLTKNYLLNDENKFVAMVFNSKPKDLNDIISYMVNEGAGLTRPQAIAYFERLMQTVGFWLENGCAVNTPLVKFHTSISGSFRDEMDCFDVSRHQLNIRATPGNRMKSIVTNAKLERSKALNKVPVVLYCIDILTEEENSVVSPGGIGILRGLALSFDKADPQQGVFMVPASKYGPEVRVVKYSLIKPQQVHFLCPPLVPGEYTVEVRTKSRNGKELLCGALQSAITVELTGLYPAHS